MQCADLSRQVAFRITRLELGEEFTAGLVRIRFEVQAHFGPVSLDGICRSAIGSWEARSSVFQTADDDATCHGFSAPDFDEPEQSVPLAGRIATRIFQTELIK